MYVADVASEYPTVTPVLDVASGPDQSLADDVVAGVTLAVHDETPLDVQESFAVPVPEESATVSGPFVATPVDGSKTFKSTIEDEGVIVTRLKSSQPSVIEPHAYPENVPATESTFTP